MNESGRPRATADTASRLKQPSKATVLCYQHHGCLSGSLTHARTHACSTESRKICHMGRGRSSFPAQLQVHMEVKHSCMKLIHECTIVHFATADATLIAYLPTHRMHECRCKGPLCADGIGSSVEVGRCCVTGGRDEGVVLTGQ